MAVNITSAYDGEVLDQLLVRATTGNQLVAGGHIRVQPDVQKKFSIPRLRAGSMLQKRKEDPVKSDSKGNFTIDEVYLEPQDVMAFTVFNPRAFEQFWRHYQPKGNLVFSELPTEVQNAMLAEMAKVIDFELGNEFINGVAGSGEDEFFNGILTRIRANANVKTVESASEITTSNILTVLKSVRDLIPNAVRGDSNLKLFMSIDDADIYDEVLTNQTAKGKDFTETNPERYKGIRIVPLADWPKDVVVAAVASSDLNSNFWAGVAYVDDAEVIQIDKLSNASELYFFKMLMKADTNIVFGEDIVLYDGETEGSGIEPILPTITTDMETLKFDAGDEVIKLLYFSVQYPAGVLPSQYSVSTTDDWLTVFKQDKTIVNCGVKNNTGQERVGSFTITLDGYPEVSKTITVIQHAPVVLPTITTDEAIEFTATGGTKNRVVDAEGANWSVATTDDWLTVTKTGSKVKCVCAENETGAERTGTYTISLDDYPEVSVEVTVTQVGA